MKELLGEEDNDGTSVATVSQKKNQRKRRATSDTETLLTGQDGSQKEEHAEKQKDTERTEARAVPEQNKTQMLHW